MDRIIVDIDNTLWNLAPVLYDRIKELSPDLPPPARWYDWEFWKPYVSTDEAFRAIHSVHLRQEEFQPYDDARWFLESLKGRGFHIIIASHRQKEALVPTARWLEMNGLAYDEIHLSYDKTVLFDTAWGIVDDSPATLDRAREAGIVRTGLRNPWNEGTDHDLFDNLAGILEYLERQRQTVG